MNLNLLRIYGDSNKGRSIDISFLLIIVSLFIIQKLANDDYFPRNFRFNSINCELLNTEIFSHSDICPLKDGTNLIRINDITEETDF